MQHFRLHQGFVTIGSFLLARSNVFSHRELASPQSGLRGQVKGLLRHHWAGGCASCWTGPGASQGGPGPAFTSPAGTQTGTPAEEGIGRKAGAGPCEVPPQPPPYSGEVGTWPHLGAPGPPQELVLRPRGAWVCV